MRKAAGLLAALLLSGCASGPYRVPGPGDRVAIGTFPTTPATVLWSEGTESLLGADRPLDHGDCGVAVWTNDGRCAGFVVGGRKADPSVVIVRRPR